MTAVSVPFLEAIRDVSAGNAKIPQSEFMPAGSLAVVDQGRSLIAGFTNDETAAVKAATPLIVFGDHTRAIKYINFPFAMGADGVKVLQVQEGFDPKFVFHYLRSRDVPSAGYSRHFKFLKEIAVPRPPLSEQRRIAAILDHADTLRAKRRQVLTHLDALAESIFNDMFDGDLPCVPLGDLAETRLGKMLDAKKQTGEHLRPYLRNANVQWFRFDLADLLKMDFNEKERSSLSLENGDILICEGGQPGRSAIWRGELEECYFQKALHRVRLGSALEPEYFVRMMKRTVDTNGLKDFVTSSTIAHLTGEKLRTLPIPVPPLHLQREFAARIAQVAHQHDATLGACASVDNLFASLHSRAFRGEL